MPNSFDQREPFKDLELRFLTFCEEPLLKFPCPKYPIPHLIVQYIEQKEKGKKSLDYGQQLKF